MNIFYSEVLSWILELFRTPATPPSTDQEVDQEVDQASPTVKFSETLPLLKLLNPESVLSAMKNKGYLIRDGSTSNYINIIGVRSSNQESDRFDDYITVLYRSEENLEWVLDIHPATTDPGKYWLEHPMNRNGTAILVPGQYKDAYRIGLHQGKYEAVCQRAPVRVWRDNNLDSDLDYLSASDAKEGLYGINIHRSNPYSESYLVGKWSAGCQVFKRSLDFKKFMELCRLSSEKMGDNLTYTLLEESDFRN